jgi:hypothetical protein
VLNSEPLEQVEYIVEMAEFMVLQEFNEEDYTDQLALAMDVLNINLGLDPLVDADDESLACTGSRGTLDKAKGGKSQCNSSQGAKSDPSTSGTSASKGTENYSASEKGATKKPFRIGHMEILARIYGLRAKAAASFGDLIKNMQYALTTMQRSRSTRWSKPSLLSTCRRCRWIG